MHRFKLLILLVTITVSFCRAQYPFNNPSLPVDKRVHDLLDRLTTEEKISLLLYNSPGVERLGIPAYNWWNEALHGAGGMRPCMELAGQAGQRYFRRQSVWPLLLMRR